MTRSLLEPTGNDAAERAAIADRERPGTWFGDAGADGRALTQDQTEALIRAELVRTAPRSERDEVMNAVGRPPRFIRFDAKALSTRAHRAGFQRGGIDSDPLVRLLAFRAWSDRDRRWFDDRGIRRGDPLALVHGGHAIEWGYPHRQVARATEHDLVVGVADRNASAGTAVDLALELAAVGSIPPGELYNRDGRWWATLTVSARPRAARGDDGLPRRQDLLCVAYGFDRFDVEDDPQRRHGAVMTAERGCYRAQGRVGFSDPNAEGAAKAWHRCCSLLGRELHRLEAGRTAPPGDTTVYVGPFR